MRAMRTALRVGTSDWSGKLGGEDANRGKRVIIHCKSRLNKL